MGTEDGRMKLAIRGVTLCLHFSKFVPVNMRGLFPSVLILLLEWRGPRVWEGGKGIFTWYTPCGLPTHHFPEDFGRCFSGHRQI